MLAAASACRKFHVFLYGKPFTIFTDHKRHHVHNATENVGANARPGIQGGIISNYTSGHPLPRGDDTKRELGLTKHVRHYTNFVIENSFPKAINKEETVGDNGEGRRVTKTNRLSREACCSWRTRPARGTYRCATETSRKNGKVCPRRPSRNFAYKAVAPCSRVVPWNWCNGRNVEECLSCQATTVCNTSGPLLMTELPSGPWRKVSVDFVGPFLNKDMALVFWDQYVWYPVVEFTTSTSADSFIPLFTFVFNMYGILEKIKSDNGLPINGSEFSNFAQEQGFKNWKVTAAWAEANGDRERFLQMLKKSAKIARLEGKLIRQEVQKTIGNYRAMPHQVTKQTPDQVTFGRELRRKLPKRVVPKKEVLSDHIR